MRKVLILGAGRSQLPLINVCKTKGFFVIAVGMQIDDLVHKAADKTIIGDIRNKNSMLEIALSEDVCGVMTDQTDAGVQSVAFVTEKMGLPTIGLECAKRFTDKGMMRKAVGELGIAQPLYEIVKSVSDLRKKIDAIGFPCFVKPVDSYASKGVGLAKNIDELELLFKDAILYSYSQCAIIEQYITGELFEIEGFTYESSYTALCISRETNFHYKDTYVPNTEFFCSAECPESKIEERIISIDRTLVEGLGLKFGMSQSEYIYNDIEEKIYLVETAARGGGCFISSNIIPRACGVDALSLLCDCSTSLDLRENEIRLKEGAAGFICFALPDGVIKRIEGLELLESQEGVDFVYFDGLEVGKQTKTLKDKQGRYGPIVVYAKNRDGCKKIMNTIRDTIIIDVETQHGIEKVIW